MNYREGIKKIDDTAREAMRKIVAADNDLRRAEKLMSDANSSHDERRIVHAKSNLLDCQEAVRATRKEAEAALASLEGIKAEVMEDVIRGAAVNPEHVDAAAVELLKSGVMGPVDYNLMAEKYAQNPTMTRLIGKYAGDAAKIAEEAKDGAAARQYRAVSISAASVGRGDREASGVDVMMDVFSRCIRNHALIPKYNELTCPVTGYRPQE